MLFAKEFVQNRNDTHITIHHLYKTEDGCYTHRLLHKVKFNRKYLSYDKYLKDNHIGKYAENDNLTTDMNDKYLSKLKQERKDRIEKACNLNE